MSRIAIIADDLTGAADAGVMFCPCAPSVLMISDRRFPSLPAANPPAVVAVHTDSRALPPESARKQVGSLMAGWKERTPERIFKKIDSSLRGNLGAETEAILEGSDFGCSFISAAFPGMGRTTMGGIHRIHGVPVAETELRRDPATPVTDSRLAAVVAAQTRRPVGHVGLEILDGGPEILQQEVERLRSRGCLHLTFDGTEQRHLELIAALADSRPEKVLLVGTAGLARAAALRWGAERREDREPLLEAAGAPPLYVCGTAAERTAQQVAALQAETGCAVVELEAALLADEARRQAWEGKALELARMHAAIEMVLRVVPGPEGREYPAEAVARGLGSLTADLAQRRRPRALFCCGGDTAAAVMEELGAWGSELFREVVPGMVLGVLRGGVLDGVPLVTKPGSFGQVEDLVALHRYLAARAADKKGQNPR